ncbi:MAG TPA: hypothetical protein VN436_03120 [Holophaga sp.]|nr:hypothetical protein [Holophaga sp.]
MNMTPHAKEIASKVMSVIEDRFSRYPARPSMSLEEEIAYTVEEELDEVTTWVKDECKPEDVFDEDELVDWAERNGYIEKA